MQSFFAGGSYLSLQESAILVALCYKKLNCPKAPKDPKIWEINPTECTPKIELVGYSTKEESNYS